MNIKELINSLDDDNRLNESLELIEDIIIDTPDELIIKLQNLINHPEKIANTNRFASLLSDWDSEEFINPLIQKITGAVPGKTSWLNEAAARQKKQK